MGEFDPRVRFTQSPIARLATTTRDGIPHLVPVVFAFDAGSQDGHGVVYTAIDAKPKTTRWPRRLANIESNPEVCLLVDHYADDWTRLWWVRVDGVAAIHQDDETMNTGYRLLRAKYPQYQSVPLIGPVIAVSVRRWSSWHA
ncbi:MAG: TIGR03668 family PPOX class F420-dependent oxidoreductase [Mycobacterium sp.]